MDESDQTSPERDMLSIRTLNLHRKHNAIVIVQKKAGIYDSASLATNCHLSILRIVVSYGWGPDRTAPSSDWQNIIPSKPSSCPPPRCATQL